MNSGISGWLLGTYRKIRFLAIMLLVIGLVLWYFNSSLFYDLVHGTIDMAVVTGNMMVDFVGGF